MGKLAINHVTRYIQQDGRYTTFSRLHMQYNSSYLIPFNHEMAV